MPSLNPSIHYTIFAQSSQVIISNPHRTPILQSMTQGLSNSDKRSSIWVYFSPSFRTSPWYSGTYGLSTSSMSWLRHRCSQSQCFFRILPLAAALKLPVKTKKYLEVRPQSQQFLCLVHIENGCMAQMSMEGLTLSTFCSVPGSFHKAAIFSSTSKLSQTRPFVI